MMQMPANANLSRRRSSRWLGAALACAAGMALTLPAPAKAQQPGMGQNRIGQLDNDRMYPVPPLGPDQGDIVATEKRLNALNAERQKSMVADTDKLLKLATELNAEINNAHPSQLTPAQLRMVAEIEKLAHNIREKMSTSVKQSPAMTPPSIASPSLFGPGGP